MDPTCYWRHEAAPGAHYTCLDGKSRVCARCCVEECAIETPAWFARCASVLLVEHFLKRHARNMGIATPSLDDAALELLKGYPFPGNVRELENILERAITLCDGNIIHASDLHLPNHGAAEHDEEDESDIDEEFNLEEYLAAIEKRAITEALEKTDYNKTAAAKLLGISFRALRYRLKKLEME